MNEIGRKLRVLIVEDEPIAREILGDLLKMAGYDVLADRSGEQALLTLRRERGRIECLFTAVELPGLVDGWMLAEELRTANPAAPVVFAAGCQPASAPRMPDTALVARPVLPPNAVEAINRLTGRIDGAPVRGSQPRAVGTAPAPDLAETPAPLAEAPDEIAPLRRAG